MDLTLAENIRSCRKQRRLTQEQLAEVLGVTAGAVYKWESGLSVPELGLIVEMADFFDSSVDALLGYKMQDNRLDSVEQRMEEYLRSGDPKAVAEAEKALKKYPNSFKIVHSCAMAYLINGTQNHHKDNLYRAIELFQQALLLIPQNADPSISEHGIYGRIGDAYIALGEYEKGLDFLKRHNTSKIFSDEIGMVLATYLHRAEEAEPYLFEALLQSIVTLINVISGYTFVYNAQKKYQQGKGLLLWGEGLLEGLETGDAPSFMDKAHIFLLVMLAHAQIHAGEPDRARDSMKKAWHHVQRFDAAPDFSLGSLRFITIPENSNLYDNFGSSAEDSMVKLVQLLRDPVLDSLWEGIREGK